MELELDDNVRLGEYEMAPTATRNTPITPNRSLNWFLCSIYDSRVLPGIYGHLPPLDTQKNPERLPQIGQSPSFGAVKSASEARHFLGCKLSSDALRSFLGHPNSSSYFRSLSSSAFIMLSLVASSSAAIYALCRSRGIRRKSFLSSFGRLQFDSSWTRFSPTWYPMAPMPRARRPMNIPKKLRLVFS